MKQPQTTTNKIFSKRQQRIISSTVILGMLNMVTLPAQAAIQQNQQAQQATHIASQQSSWEQLTELTAQHRLMVSGLKLGRSIHKSTWYETAWHKIISLFTDDAETIAERQDALSTVDQVLALRLKTMQEQTAIMQDIMAQANQLKSSQASAEILQRQADLVKQLDSRYQILQGLFTQLQSAKQSGNASEQQQALDVLDKQIQAWQPKAAQTDMQHLPWGTPDSTVRAPITADNPAKPVNYSVQSKHAYKSTSIGQWRNTEYQYAQYLQQHQNPIRPIATTQSGTTATGDWPVLKSLPATVQDEDLQANEDVSISPEIQALAKQLHYNPAQIYKWVYDNIEYVPTYGSIQGAAYTLETKRGNAFDTSSLLIALLRTSKIPARYVYGTIEVPANTVKDWVGGVNSVDAAQNLMGQGGIPNIGLTSGSQTVAVRVEHVWVEAALPFLPNRGALSHADDNANIINPDAEREWVPLDASYKRHNRTAGVDIAKAVPFDANALINSIQAGATIDPTTGSVQNIDQTKIDTAITAYNAQVQAYLTQNYPNATVGDILGKTDIRPYQSKILSPVLPYKVNTVIADYQTLPDTMRSYFVLNLYANADEQRLTAGMDELPAFNVRIPTTRLQGQSLALSFKPSSQADEDTLLSYLPKPDASGKIDPNQLPKSLPSASIHFTPEFTLNGEVLKSLNSYSFGQDVNFSYGFVAPNRNLPLATKTVHSGEYHAIGYSLQGTSAKQLQNIKNQLEQAKAKLETQDQAQLATLTKHDLTGAMLQAGVQSYFGLNESQDHIVEQQAGMVGNAYFSYGTFSTNIQPVVRYGITMSAKLAGMMMDIDRLSAMRVNTDNDRDAWVAFNAAQGARHSANEHLVPESLFDNPQTVEQEVNAYSAVKALQIAAQQGQKIFTITQANISNALPQLQQKSIVIDDIQNAVAAGKVVTISQTTISQNGWTGVGYSIVDPATGAGAYLIGGAADGAFAYITGLLLGIAITTAITAFVVETGGLGALYLANTAPILLLEITAIWEIIKIQLNKMAGGNTQKAEFYRGCFVQGFLTGIPFGKDVEFIKGEFLAALLGHVVSLPNTLTCLGIELKP